MITKELLRKITIVNTVLMIVFYNSIAWFFGDSVPFYKVPYFILYAIFSNLTGCVVYLKEKGESEDLIKKMLWFSLTGLFFITITTFVNRDFQFEYVFAIGSILSMYYIYTTNYDIAFGKFTVDLKVWKKDNISFLNS